jgi:hypothetical protein
MKRGVCAQAPFGPASDAVQALVGSFERVVGQREASQLDEHQPTRDVLIEAGEVAQHRLRVRLAEQDAADRARVDVGLGRRRAGISRET